AVYVACLTVIFAASNHPPLSIYVCGVLLMLVFVVAGAQLRFRFALICTVLCLAIFAGGLAAMHRFGTGSRETVGLLA
ncbi:hypothetical protein ACSTKS_23490, partial [Vibrio parahaemolyticus]